MTLATTQPPRSQPCAATDPMAPRAEAALRPARDPGSAMESEPSGERGRGGYPTTNPMAPRA
ncbi:MAG TPA: hypothetical protein VME66_16335, partial [Candidatus Acidoferrales bacterium]|nr:hypothetical protein [Candidatus Acidoferrales bacterium]